MGGRLWRWYAARVRRNWPTALAGSVGFLSTEIFDDDKGAKDVWVWIAGLVVAVVAYWIFTWVQGDPSADSPDARQR